MHEVIPILLGIVSSFGVSFLLWLLTFKHSRTKVEFSKNIEKSKAVRNDHGAFRYRIRFINSGSRDLTEVVLLVVITIKGLREKLGEDRDPSTYLGLGDGNKLPILRGKGYQYQHKVDISRTLTLFPISETFIEFQKDYYDEQLQERAKDKNLHLDDIFERYGKDVELTFFVYGNDAVTGARKMFQSQIYTYDDIVTGRYHGAVKLPKRKWYHRKYRDYVKNTLKLKGCMQHQAST